MIQARIFPFRTAAALALLFGLLLWADLTMPHFGMWALLVLGISVGFLHGALDVVLLPLRSSSTTQSALLFVAYLFAVLLLGWLLSGAISLALGLLLALSVWHFGEPFGRWNGLTRFQASVTRAVVGGAPVMLPVWLAPGQFETALTGVVPEIGLRGWHVMAWCWLGIFVLWSLLCGVLHKRTLRYAWFELIGCTALFVIFSPLMAFALYFGAYHAPVHIYRVWRAHAKITLKMSMGLASMAIILTTIVAWLLGIGLERFFMLSTATAPDSADALRWFIVAFAALTAPHLVLISLNAHFLSDLKTSR